MSSTSALWLGLASIALWSCGDGRAPGRSGSMAGPMTDAEVQDASPADGPTLADQGPAPPALPTATPAAPTLNRLTQSQYRNIIGDVLGDDLALPPTLEPDVALEGLFSVGASATTVSARGVELYDEAARSLARQVLSDPDRRLRILQCVPANPADEACFRSLITGTGRRLLRRAPTDSELDALTSLGVRAAAVTQDFYAAAEFVLSALLQSPSFLYRAEIGLPDVAAPGLRRLTDLELATRLAFFLWNSSPDDALLELAAAETLHEPATLELEVDRMLADPRSRRGVRNFFDEWLGLQSLTELRKDPNVFRHYAADLGAMAREETLRSADHLVFELDADLRDFLTTRHTFVNRRLAAIYNVRAAEEDDFGPIELPAEGERRGFLGQVSFLAGHSHPTSSSATLRGLFVRETLLCDEIPPPPSNLNTAIPQASERARTLRQRLEVHMQDPTCRGCHQLTDPVGLGFERFDGIGRHRLMENEVPIDPSGDLDTSAFVEAKELGQRIAESPKFSACFTRKVMLYALGRSYRPREDKLVAEALTARFDAGGRRVKSLLKDVSTAELFLRLGEVQP
ncbi:MAG: DUF1592 domain-containing protein [Myxococcales bacterium]|nr:DUF1592 domain-containing protein [Myxococcales bacterium]